MYASPQAWPRRAPVVPLRTRTRTRPLRLYVDYSLGITGYGGSKIGQRFSVCFWIFKLPVSPPICSLALFSSADRGVFQAERTPLGIQLRSTNNKRSMHWHCKRHYARDHSAHSSVDFVSSQREYQSAHRQNYAPAQPRVRH